MSSLDRTAVERVLRRASELSNGSSSGADGDDDQQPGRISEAALIEAATETGLDVDALRLSLAIERLGPPARRTLADRVAGRASIMIDRSVDIDAPRVLASLDRLLVGEHHLRRIHLDERGGEWRRRTDATAAVQRAARGLHGAGRLGSVARIEVRVTAIDPRRAALRVIADRRGQRAGFLAGGAGVGGAGVAGTVVAGLLLSPLVLIAAPVAAVGGLAVASVGRGAGNRLDEELAVLLDRMSRGDEPSALVDGARRALRALRSKPA
jgi:hypothetical protein